MINLKKFSFPLDTVLGYKSEILENLRNEHGRILAAILKQEEYIESIKEKYRVTNYNFNEKKMNGITIVEASSYEVYLRSIELEIKRENRKLLELNQQEEKKREEVVEAKKETSSIEKLKEKKLEIHNKEIQKSEELFIEEFVANCRVANV